VVISYKYLLKHSRIITYKQSVIYYCKLWAHCAKDT